MPKRARPPKGRARNELVYKSLFNFFFLFSTRVCKVDAEPICLPDSGAPLSSADRTAQAGIPIGDSTCPFPRDVSSTFLPAGVLLRRFTRDRLALFALRKDRKVLLDAAAAMTLSRDTLNDFPEGLKRSRTFEIPSPKIRGELPLTSPILRGGKFQISQSRRGEEEAGIRRRGRNGSELPRDERSNARYGLPYDSSIDKKLFPAATSYIIFETETDNEIPLSTVGARSAINHDERESRRERPRATVSLSRAPARFRESRVYSRCETRD